MATPIPKSRRLGAQPKSGALLFVLLLASTVANAESYFPLRVLLAPEQRIQASGRQVLVMTEKELLNSRVNQLGLASALGGGFVNALIDQAVEDSRKEKAEGPLEEIRASIASYDLNKKVVEAATQISTNLEWLSVKEVRSTRGIELPSENLSSMAEAELLIIQYKFQIEPRFDSIRLFAHAELVTKELVEKMTLGKIKKSKSTDGLKFSQDFICFVPLQDKKSDMLGNAAEWANNNGELTRQSIELAISGVTKMMTKALTVTEAERKIVSEKKATRVGYSEKAVENISGKIVSEDETGTLLETKFGEWVYYYWPTQK